MEPLRFSAGGRDQAKLGYCTRNGPSGLEAALSPGDVDGVSGLFFTRGGD